MGTRKPESARPRRIQVPFMGQQEVGLGDAIKKMTGAVGIKPCGGCQKRAEALNKRFVLSGRKCTDC
ncbi:MAG: hypothetical protein CL920_14885 [Deltaproteobacteria bacterium]|nr:hypothetical protein [Deltaproteobacteria bacterium]|tara:strand:+ start:1796 stop:1996 length:201 start_codon:yes stop_codon:yes gene_type:complete